MTYPTGDVVATSYTNHGPMGSVNLTSGGTMMPAGTDNQASCYDNQSRLTWAGSTGNASSQTVTSGTLTAANYTQTYAYDTSDRLTSGPMGAMWYSASQPYAVTTANNGYGGQSTMSLGT